MAEEHCSNCGHGLPNRAKFCEECGAKVAQAISSESKKSKWQRHWPTGLLLGGVGTYLCCYFVPVVIDGERGNGLGWFFERWSREEAWLLMIGGIVLIIAARIRISGTEVAQASKSKESNSFFSWDASTEVADQVDEMIVGVWERLN